MPMAKWHSARLRSSKDFVKIRSKRTGPLWLIGGRLKGRTGWTTQAIWFPSTWSKKRVHAWLVENKYRPLYVKWAKGKPSSQILCEVSKRNSVIADLLQPYVSFGPVKGT